MSRYDYYESMERRIEKLERELARKDELFGLFKKKDKSSTSGKTSKDTVVSQNQIKEFQYSMLEKGAMKHLGAELYKNSRGAYYYEYTVTYNMQYLPNKLRFTVGDGGNGDGQTAVVNVFEGTRKIDSFMFNVDDKKESYKACNFIIDHIKKAFKKYKYKY